MRIKGETPEEMAGFLDATHERLARFPAAAGRMPLVVIPSYNGARKLPVLTPLLALLLAREGLPVLLHGSQTEARRVTSASVLEAMGMAPLPSVREVKEGEVAHVTTQLLCPGLKRLLDVRQVVGLRNPAHSVVKLLLPADGDRQLLVSSYTHPAYAESMAETFALMQTNALLSRGLEGESVADPRRTAQVDGFVQGRRVELQAQAPGTLDEVPGLPASIELQSTLDYTRRVLGGQLPAPDAISRQVEHVLRLVQLLDKPQELDANTTTASLARAA
jgi:anthranilate phosphoribosyltransferase